MISKSGKGNVLAGEGGRKSRRKIVGREVKDLADLPKALGGGPSLLVESLERFLAADGPVANHVAEKRLGIRDPVHLTEHEVLDRLHRAVGFPGRVTTGRQFPAEFHPDRLQAFVTLPRCQKEVVDAEDIRIPEAEPCRVRIEVEDRSLEGCRKMSNHAGRSEHERRSLACDLGHLAELIGERLDRSAGADDHRYGAELEILVVVPCVDDRPDPVFAGDPEGFPVYELADYADEIRIFGHRAASPEQQELPRKAAVGVLGDVHADERYVKGFGDPVDVGVNDIVGEWGPVICRQAPEAVFADEEMDQVGAVTSAAEADETIVRPPLPPAPDLLDGSVESILSLRLP